MEINQFTERALELYKSQDSFAAIIYLSQLGDPRLTLNSLADLMRHQYWQEKDLVGALAFARSGNQFGLQTGSEFDAIDPELAYELRSAAKGFAYNFASFAWRGWAEPGVEITIADQAAGFDAAKVNLRLALELERGDLPTSRAYWMLAAYYLAEAKYELAINNFEQAISFAGRANTPIDELLNHGYVLISKMLQAENDLALKEDYAKLKNAFLNVEHGEDYIQQLETAYRVFQDKKYIDGISSRDDG